MQLSVTGDAPASAHSASSLATWSRERSGEELQNFIINKHETVDVSDLLAELGVSA